METKLDHDEATRDLGETTLVTNEAVDGGDAPETETRAFEAAPRWILVVRSGPEAGRRIGLEAGRVSLGRSARCAIRLDDPSISRLHLWVEPRPEGVLLQEESTKNGTTLDGAPCLEGLAEAGQRIGLGQTVLEVEQEAYERPSRGIVEQAMRVLGAGRAPPKPRPREAPPRRRPLLLLGALAAALGGIALLAFPLESAPEEAAGAGEMEKEEAARRAFDEGIEQMEAGDEEGARSLFTRAARWDPGSEEPGRYLRWLDEAGAVGPAGGEPLEPPPFEGAWGEEAAASRESVPAGEVEGIAPEAPAEDEARPAPAPPPRRRVARRPRPRVAEAREAARREVRALLEGAEGEEGIAAVRSLRAAWEKARALRGAGALQEETRGRLARAAFAVGEDALALGRLGRAVAHFQLTLEAAPDHPAARARLASLEARAASYLVEGYALLERDPDRARAWLELVLALKEPRDPLYQRAQKWLQRTRPEPPPQRPGGQR